MERQYFLDGLRGWGSVAVLLYHIFCSGLSSNDFSREYLKLVPIFNGIGAVSVFFIVSGFALAMPLLAQGKRSALIRVGIGRYPRLVIPIFTICLIVHVVNFAGFIAPPPDRYPPFAWVFSIEHPTWWHLIRFSLFDVFFNYSHITSYAGPLWTMSAELIGSFLVIGLLLIIPANSRLICISLLALVLLTLGSVYSLFVFGAAMADFWSKGYLSRIPKWTSMLFLAFAVTAPFMFPYSINTGIMLGAMSFMLFAVSHVDVRKFMSNRVSRELGRLSFPLYLVHGPVMMIVGAPLMLSGELGHPLAVQMLALLLSVAAAYAFAPANSFALFFSRRFASAVMGMCYLGVARAALR